MSNPPQKVVSELPGSNAAEALLPLKQLEAMVQELQKAHEEYQKPGNRLEITGSRLISHATSMLGVLDIVKDIHIFVLPATIPFRLTLQMALPNQENNKRVEVLMFAMVDMMLPLTGLHKIEAESSKDGKTVENHLVDALATAKEAIESAANLVNNYIKLGTWDRVFRANSLAAEFEERAQLFQRGKEKIQQALAMHTVLAVDALHMKLDHLIKMFHEWIKNPPNIDEQNLLQSMGGHDPQEFLENRRAFIKLYKKLASGTRARQPAGGSSTEGRIDDKEKAREAREQWGELQKSLPTLLLENRSIFQGMLDIQTKDAEAALHNSTSTIIRAFNEGPYEYINHSDIQVLWKAMQWRLSVKTRHFVMALHDHYLHGTYAASYAVDAQTPVTPSSPSSALQAPYVDTDDQWCLQYLQFQYLPAICEAFDDDGSGFIRISEVNDFTDGIPEHWNLLKWVAYWTGSWPREMWQYALRIQATMVEIAEAQCSVKPENIEFVNDYMNGTGFAWTRVVATSINLQDTNSRNPDLDRLANEHRKQTEDRIKDRLEKIQYYIDEPNAVRVFDPLSGHDEKILRKSNRIERFLLPLIHLILRRHLEIIRFASTHALHPREMSCADTTLWSIMSKVMQRVEELKESFRQQRRDIGEEFQKFSCGLYSRFSSSDDTIVLREIGLTPQNPNLDDDDQYSSDDSDDTEDLSPRTLPPSVPSVQIIHGGGSDVGPSSNDPAVDESGLVDSKSPSAILEAVSPISSLDTSNDDGMLSWKTPHCGTDTQTRTSPAPMDFSRWQSSRPFSSRREMDTEVEANSPGPETFSSPVNHCTHLPTTPTSDLNIDRDTPNQLVDPTRFGPYSPDEGTVPWRPLRAKFADVGPREMFRLAAQRVIERVRVLSPRLTLAYIQRRRSVRLQWAEVTNNYISEIQHNSRLPLNEEMLEDLKLQMSPADVAYLDSLQRLQDRLRSRHTYWCNGCGSSEIFGKMFHCLDCPDFDLCDDCEHTESPKHDVTQHPPSHTLMQFNYPVRWSRQAYEIRAREYMIQHFKQACPCSDTGSGSPSTRTAIPLRCCDCKKEIRNEGHFRCLQCLDYDLCETCERNVEHRPDYDLPTGCKRQRPPQHCVAHVLLKLKAPFIVQETDGSQDLEQSVDARLTQLAGRVSDLEAKFGRRLDELQTGFDVRIAAFGTRLDDMQRGLDAHNEAFSNRLDELQHSTARVIALLEQAGTRAYLYGSTRSP